MPLFGLLLPLLTFYFSQVGYATVAGANTLSRPGFVTQYVDGVYRYRIVGRELVLAVYDHLGWLNGTVAVLRPAWLTQVVGGVDPAMWSAHLVVNAVGYVAFCSILVRLLVPRLGDRGIVVCLLVQMLVLASGWMITPYDFLGYALLIGAIAAFRWPSRWAAVVVPLVVLVGTLNRESQAVAVAFMAVCTLCEPRARLRRNATLTGLSLAAFVAGYVGVRFAVGGTGVAANKVTFGLQSVLSMVGVAAALLSVWLVHRVTGWAVRRPVLLVEALGLAAMLPYLVTVALVGFYVEYRLFVPVFVTLALLACLCPGPVESSVLGRLRLGGAVPLPPGGAVPAEHDRPLSAAGGRSPRR